MIEGIAKKKAKRKSRPIVIGVEGGFNPSTLRVPSGQAKLSPGAVITAGAMVVYPPVRVGDTQKSLA